MVWAIAACLLGYRDFILPFFIYTQPEVARTLLYRYHTARRRRPPVATGALRCLNAATGDEVTPDFVPSFHGNGLVRIWTGEIEIHISADVAYALMQYWRVTGDDAFMRDYGAEMILETARFWADRAEPESANGETRYAYRDVIGPDEYHDHVDNNVFTNRMAQWHLRTAQELLGWLREQYPEKAPPTADRPGGRGAGALVRNRRPDPFSTTPTARSSPSLRASLT